MNSDRVAGSMFGLAIGDAMGMPVEFRPRGNFDPVTEYRAGGPFKLQAGQWTDDTAMSLCLASSLIECNGFDAAHQMKQYSRWIDDGYLSCTGKAVGIGQTILKAMIRTTKPKTLSKVIQTQDDQAMAVLCAWLQYLFILVMTQPYLSITLSNLLLQHMAVKCACKPQVFLGV